MCSDRNVVNAYNNDPLCAFSFTMNGYESLLTLMNKVYTQKNWNVSHPDLPPIHFISGQQDPCMTNMKMFNQSIQLMKDIGYKNVNYKVYENMRHEILNETNKHIVYEDILNKLKEWEK